jgi:hypothetical protein
MRPPVSVEDAARGFLLGVCLMTAALVALRAWIGPYLLVVSPMNAESAFAICALLALATLSGARDLKADPRVQASGLWLTVAIPLLAIAAFLPVASMPLLYDDYSHADKISRAGAGFWKAQIIAMQSGFFRPLGIYMYRLDSLWAGRNPFLWRADNLLLHGGNAVLLFLLARRVGLARWAAGFAALLFAWHGSRPEAVAWVAARFDLLAAGFVFAGLILLFRYCDHPHPLVLCAAGAMCLCGLLSKEEAFVFPLLATALLWRRLPGKVLGGFYALTAVVFVYRWRLLGGIGGYLNETGAPTILNLNAQRTAKALLLRLWAVLWFPIDWLVEPGAWLAIATMAMLAAWVWLLYRRPTMHWPSLAFTFLAALPVQHLLLIGPDLEKSRVLYLPAAGFALVAAFAVQSIGYARMAAGAAGLILAFQLAALEHNLAIWKRVSGAARAACQQAGSAIQETGRDATVVNLPNLLDGVYFLRNGFPECVEWNTGVPQSRVHVVDRLEDSGHADRLILRWNGSSFISTP